MIVFEHNDICAQHHNMYVERFKDYIELARRAFPSQVKGPHVYPADPADIQAMFPLAFKDDAPVPSKISEYAFNVARSTTHCRRSSAALESKSSTRLSKKQRIQQSPHVSDDAPPQRIPAADLRQDLVQFVMGTAGDSSVSALPHAQHSLQRLAALKSEPAADHDSLKSEPAAIGDRDVKLEAEPYGAPSSQFLPGSTPNPLTGDLSKLRAITMQKFGQPPAKSAAAAGHVMRRLTFKQPDIHNVFGKLSGFTKRYRSSHAAKKPAAAASVTTDGELTTINHNIRF